MSNQFSDIFAALAEAPDSQIDAKITARLRTMATAEQVSAAEMKALLDECCYASLASDFAMQAMHTVWCELKKAEGILDPPPLPPPAIDVAATREALFTKTEACLQAEEVSGEMLGDLMTCLSNLCYAGAWDVLNEYLATYSSKPVRDPVVHINMVRFLYQAHKMHPDLLTQWPLAVDAIADLYGDQAPELLQGLTGKRYDFAYRR
jgi:hypothetical protein